MLALTVWSCRSERHWDDTPDIPDASELRYYLELAVSTDGGYAYTRANPTGGENGDGLEHGRGNENKIHNLSVFVYIDEGEGLDGDYDFIWSRYADDQTISENNPDLPYDCIYYVKMPIDQQDMAKFEAQANGQPRAVVVANAGNISNSFSSTTDLRTSTAYEGAWTESNGIADNFVMATAFNGAKKTNNLGADDGIITVKSDKDGEMKYDCRVSLERIAARIDIEVTDDNIKGTPGSRYLEYKVKDTEHTLKLTNAIPVNMMQERSFLLKHVSDGADNTSSGWLCGGDETISGQRPTNYVMTPSFSLKPNAEKVSGWYGATSAAELRKKDAESLENLKSLSVVDDAFVAKAFQYDGAAANRKSIILTYANENTHPMEIQTSGENHKASDYLTGLLLRAQYHPAILYTSGQVGPGAPSKSYSDGEDFWLFRTVGDEVSESANLYFSSSEALNEYIASLPGGGKYETQLYIGGICYYNVWIKHANVDDSDENYPMKYGIVRNNIYRLSFSFSGIGQPTPDLTEPYNVTFRVYVKKWNFRVQPEIIM